MSYNKFESENERLTWVLDQAQDRIAALEAGINQALAYQDFDRLYPLVEDVPAETGLTAAAAVLARNDADGVMTLEWVEGATTAVVAREVLEELVRARNERDELRDDVTKAIQVRNVVVRIAAEYVNPGPDGQDDLDRRQLIEQWLAEAYEEAGSDGPTELEVVTAERDAARAQIAVLDRLVCRCAPSTPAPETPATCPTCGSDDPERDYPADPSKWTAELGPMAGCDDTWHAAAPESGDEQ